MALKYTDVKTRQSKTPGLENFVLTNYIYQAVKNKKSFWKGGKEYFYDHKSKRLRITDAMVLALFSNGSGQFDPNKTDLFQTLEEANAEEQAQNQQEETLQNVNNRMQEEPLPPNDAQIAEEDKNLDFNLTEEVKPVVTEEVKPVVTEEVKPVVTEEDKPVTGRKGRGRNRK